MALYILFATHEYPFIVLDFATGVSWEEIQALWHRLTLGMCLLHTIHAKIMSTRSSKTARTGTNVSQASSVRPATVVEARPPTLARSIPSQRGMPTVTLIRCLSTEYARRKSSVTPIGGTKAMVKPMVKPFEK